MLVAETPTRTLRPAKLMRRLRPVKLEKVAHYLGDFGRRARVLGLMHTHFPDQMDEKWTALDFWFENYYEFLRHVDRAGWFSVDWPMLEMYEVNWMENGEDDCIGFDVLVDYLLGMPVECWGRGLNTPELEYGDPGPIQEYPALELLRFCLKGAEDGRALTDEIGEMLDSIGFYDTADFNKWEVMERFERATKRMKPPWRWLPEMARFAADESGNVILDTTIDYHEPWPTQWLWDKDLDKIKAEWVKAKPVIERFEEFVNEVKSDWDLEKIAYIAMGRRMRRK